MITLRAPNVMRISRSSRVKVVGVPSASVSSGRPPRASTATSTLPAEPVSPRCAIGNPLPIVVSFALSASRQPCVSTSSSEMMSGSMSAIPLARASVLASNSACVGRSSKSPPEHLPLSQTVLKKRRTLNCATRIKPGRCVPPSTVGPGSPSVPPPSPATLGGGAGVTDWSEHAPASTPTTVTPSVKRARTECRT